MFSTAPLRIARGFTLSRRVPALFPLSASTGTAVLLSALHEHRALIFQDAKGTFDVHGTDKAKGYEPPQSNDLLRGEVKSHADIPSAHAMEKALPSVEQLHAELPSSEDVKRAIEDERVAPYIDGPKEDDVENEDD